MPTVKRLEDKFGLPQFEVVLDDGFVWRCGYNPLQEEYNFDAALIIFAEYKRDLDKQSGRWNPDDAKKEGTQCSGDKRAA